MIFPHSAWEKDEKSDKYRGGCWRFCFYGFTANLYIEESYSGQGRGWGARVGMRQSEQGKEPGQDGARGQGVKIMIFPYSAWEKYEKYDTYRGGCSRFSFFAVLRQICT